LDAWRRQDCDLYNAALQERRSFYDRYEKSISYNAQTKSLTEWRASDPEARAVPAVVQRSPLARVDRAFKAFFRRCKAGEKPGYPRFKPKKRYRSFTVPGAEVKLEGKLLTLPKLPDIPVHLYRPIQGRILEVTISRDGEDRWFASFVCDLGEAPPKPAPTSVVGIDLGLNVLAMTSEGEAIKNPRHRAEAQAKIARISRMVARRKKGSSSRRRAVRQLARAHAHVANQRLDHARKVACLLFSKYDAVVYEDLNIKGLTRSMLGGAINNVGWGILLRCLTLKAESAGKWGVGVDPRGTSQRCSRCGLLVPKDLGVRVHACPHCGLRIDRDWNAAINICALGRSAAPWTVPPAPPPGTEATSNLGSK